MFSPKSHQSLTRRGSKLLVEMVIGVIGILGIMLAQLGEQDNGAKSHRLEGNGEAIGIEVIQVTPKIDWSEILF